MLNRNGNLKPGREDTAKIDKLRELTKSIPPEYRKLMRQYALLRGRLGDIDSLAKVREAVEVMKEYQQQMQGLTQCLADFNRRNQELLASMSPKEKLAMHVLGKKQDAESGTVAALNEKRYQVELTRGVNFFARSEREVSAEPAPDAEQSNTLGM